MHNSGFHHPLSALAYSDDKVQEITRVIRHPMVRPGDVLHVPDVPLLTRLHMGQVELTECKRMGLLLFYTCNLQYQLFLKGEKKAQDLKQFFKDPINILIFNREKKPKDLTERFSLQ